ncbi:MAG: inositol monophosphatase family protein, partial [Candidatus Omnitrophota bacterium]|nr:inositol monophosphatase family protein [Candidatus Omnitrophota bacterium]
MSKLKPEQYLAPRMLNFVFEAGRIALKFFDNSHPQLKPDRSIVTQADKEISKLSGIHFKDLLQTSQHLIIDEENSDVFDYLDQNVLEKSPYVWAIDPIDGTRVYANHMAHFGISIGLFKDLRPFMGAVYFPALEELFYCDGGQGYFVRHPFSAQETKTVLRPLDQTISAQSIFMCDDSLSAAFDWDYKDCQIMVTGCASVDLCWPAIGRGCGTLFKSSLWDFAGSWPVARSAGLELRHFPSGKVLEKINVRLF